MKDTIKLVILHVAVIVIAFVGALIFFNYRISSEKGNPVAELANSTYPIMEIGGEAADYNLMSAYRGDIDLSLVRNQITVVDHSQTVELKLHHYDYDITAIQYSLFENDPENPLEEGTLNQLTELEGENTRTGTITFQNDLKQGKSYYLKMAVRLDNSTRAYFYTKIQKGGEYHLNEYATYALNFHNNLFDKCKMEENAVYLEPSGNGGIGTLEYVNLHSSVADVFFGNMEVKQESEPRIKVREINDTYAILELDTLVSSEISDNVIQYYDVEETYKLRYTQERMYLLDYQRTMDAYYNEAMIDSANNYIGLGIQNEKNISYLYSDEGHKLCFASEGQLWYYDYDNSNVSKVYSFSSENLGDIRNDQEDHGIKILKMSDKGVIYYLVYGYISRGRHEGANGIQIMKYDPGTNCNEELAFLISSVPYNNMKEDLEKLSYLNSDRVFYCMLDGDLHQVNLDKKEDVILESGMVNESLTASKDQSIIALEKDQDICNNTEIKMIDLESGQTQTFTCPDNQRIRSVGFLAEDFIYGTALATEVSRATSGVVTFPVKQLHIMDIDGNEVKTYNKPGRYILETTVNGSVLEMKFGKKNGSRFIQTNDIDYIRYKEEESTDAITLTSKYSETYGSQLYFKFPDYIYIQVEPDLVLTKILTSEDDRSIVLERSGEAAEQYYVYAGGQRQDVFTNLPEAVNAASEKRGNVIDSKERTLWQCAFDEYAIVAGMDKVTKVSGDRESLAGCLSMIASVNGKNLSADEISTGSKTVSELMEQCSGHQTLNLTGCALDDVLYYISQGSPVLAKYSSRRYVVVMSYNSTKIRYLDPVTGQSTVAGRQELTETLKKAGNVFYSYLNE